MKSAMVVWKTMTDTHPGTGQDSSSVIDLPVAREGATGFPIVPGSTIKGVLRDGADLDDVDKVYDVETKALKRFGYTDRKFSIKDKNGAVAEVKRSHVGDLSFTDARLFALALPSYHGVFALVTCPMVVTRLNEMRQFCGLAQLDVPGQPVGGDAIGAWVGAGNVLADGDRHAYIHDYDFIVQESNDVTSLADVMFNIGDDHNMQKQRLIMAPDDVFNTLCETGLHITAHNSLEPKTKTVVVGGLWYQENIPPESIFTSFFSSATDDMSIIERDLEKNPYVRFGGKSTTGHGLTRQLTKEVAEVSSGPAGAGLTASSTSAKETAEDTE
ncbi:MAG: type III-B CRISPR module RAMP protein Cmr4 [Acidipropionibacterium sp.]|jgi:CRISPR-associated protein Cmr4|nr:type III-B CRISPR module RAMP protein Cmr4 [Acidipropionibacterium sp.]